MPCRERVVPGLDRPPQLGRELGKEFVLRSIIPAETNTGERFRTCERIVLRVLVGQPGYRH